jgi:hypothetical protein
MKTFFLVGITFLFLTTGISVNAFSSSYSSSENILSTANYTYNERIIKPIFQEDQTKPTPYPKPIPIPYPK